MKKIFLFLLLTTCFFACTEARKETTQAEANVVELKDTTPQAIADVVANKDTILSPPPPTKTEEENLNDSINFKKYAVEIQTVSSKAPLNWESNPGAKFFRTRIIDAYKSNTVDFAGHYIGVLFGCGADCIMGFIIDVRDGKIYESPLGESNMCSWSLDKAVCRADSRLFISAICRENEESKIPFYNASVWNEDKKIFEKTDSKDFLIEK